MNLPRKKVLIITYYFPPSGGSGVQRTLKFVKYLPEFGWEPVVLTAAENADYPVLDESLASEIPAGVKVYRSRIWEPYRWYRKFTGRAGAESTDIAVLTLDAKRKASLTERMAEGLRATFFVPDARIGWRPFATHLGRKIIREENIDVIFSSAPPYTTHLIGLTLKKQSRLPWVADFRDSWIGWVSAPQWRPWPSRKIEYAMERAVLRRADALLTVSEGVREDLLSRHPELRSRAWHFLPNGFDAADFAHVAPLPKKDKLTITYLGSLYGPRNPESLLQALEYLQKADSQWLQKICLRFIGRIGAPILQRLQRSSVSQAIEIVPYQSHEASLAYLLATDIALLIIDDAPANKGILTGKLFEYIGAGKPILALAPDGEAATLIRANNLGWVVSPHDADEIRTTLLKILQSNGKLAKMTGVNSELQNKFERRRQSGELARILEAVAAQP